MRKQQIGLVSSICFKQAHHKDMIWKGIVLKYPLGQVSQGAGKYETVDEKIKQCLQPKSILW
jgi:hypothetical protein